MGTATFRRPLLAAAVAVGAACGGSDTNAPPGDVTAIARAPTASGDAQTAMVHTELPLPLRVRVTSNGSPMAGAAVAWASTGVGSLLAPASSSTDVDGIATTLWTLPQLARSATATASLAGATGSPVSFSATALAGPAAALSSAGGDNQTGPVNTALASPLQVKAVDAFGNAVGGVSVAWAATAGGGSVNPGASSTNASGIASSTLTLGPSAGANQASAAVSGLSGSPVSFSATAQAVDNSSVTVGNNFFSPGSVTVSPGTTVTWTWTNTGSISHSVQSTGSPSFTSSAIKVGNGSSHSFTFNTAGTYTYDCAVHGAAMSGTIVVQ